MDLIDDLRRMADSGMTRREMREKTGLTTGSLNHILRNNGITTKGVPGVKAQPKDEAGPVHGVGGKPPAKLMPSREALGLVSVWGLAHSSTVNFFAPMNNS